jgi:hypothetical protein
MRTQADKAAAFLALHERPGAFIIPNPWEAGTAKLLAGLGFEALASTSLGLANMLGCPDSKVTCAEVIANCQVIAEATDLPVNADLENCFAHEPEAASETIRLAAEARRRRRVDRGLYRRSRQSDLRFRFCRRSGACRGADRAYPASAVPAYGAGGESYSWAQRHG